VLWRLKSFVLLTLGVSFRFIAGVSPFCFVVLAMVFDVVTYTLNSNSNV